MSKTLDKTSLAEACIQFQIQVKKKEIQDFNDELCRLEDKKQQLIKLVDLQQERLREEQTRHVRELNKEIKERERNLEQRLWEDEEQVKQVTRGNLELKQEQEKELEELRCKLARLQVDVEELQTVRQEWLQYKTEGSMKDHQKIEKLEEHIAFTEKIFQELSEHFQRSLVTANEEIKQKDAQNAEDGIHLALERATKNIDYNTKLSMKDNIWLNEQVPLRIKRVAVLESSIRLLEEENLEHVNNLFQILPIANSLIRQDDEILAQSVSPESHDSRNMDRNIMQISLEETSELVNRSLLEEVEGTQQERYATASDGTTPSTPPDLSERFSNQTNFTGPMHLDLLGRRLLYVMGKASPLHPPSNDPMDVNFDLLQTAKWPITTKIINSKFQKSASPSGESDESVYNTFKIQQSLDH